MSANEPGQNPDQITDQDPDGSGYRILKAEVVVGEGGLHGIAMSKWSSSDPPFGPGKPIPPEATGIHLSARHGPVSWRPEGGRLPDPETTPEPEDPLDE